MKARTFDVSFDKHEWNFSGLSSLHSEHVSTVHNMTPTVKEISVLIHFLFPDYEIDETDMTIFEQIHDSLECGFFSIHLKSNDMFIGYSVSFMEV